MPCFCYIVECADGTYYTGWTTDPERRVATHNKGRGAKYTKMRLPVKLIYVEEQANRNMAMKREIAIKKMGRVGKMKLIGENSKHGNKKIRRQRIRKKILEK